MLRSARVAAAFVVSVLTVACESALESPLAPVPDPPVGMARPVEPSDFDGSAAPGEVTLTWSDTPDETHYQIRRAPSPLNGSTGTFITLDTDVDQNGTSFVDTTMDPHTRYLYRLRACNADGCGPWAEVYVVSDEHGVPPGPANFRAVVNRAGDVVLTWAAQPYEDFFRLERAEAPLDGPLGPEELLARLDENARRYVDDAANGVRYRYQLRACNDHGCSGSTTFYVYVPHVVPPAAPVGFAGDGSSGDAVLTWSDGSTETHYELTTQLAPVDGGYSAGTDDPPPLAMNTTDYTDAQVLAGGRYRYRLRACNDAGCSAYRIVFVTVAGASAVPPTPANFAADANQTRVILTWTDGANETRYEIRRVLVRADGSTAYPVNVNVGANTTTYTDGAVGGDRRYRYRIRACRPEACSAYATIFVDTP